MYAPKNASGNYTFPQGCTYALAENMPLVTEVTFPQGCTYAWAENLPNLRRIIAPDGCAVYLDGKRIKSDHPLRDGRHPE